MILGKLDAESCYLFIYLFMEDWLFPCLINLHFRAIDNDVCLYVRSCTVGGCTKGHKYNRCVFPSMKKLLLVLDFTFGKFVRMTQIEGPQ